MSVTKFNNSFISELMKCNPAKNVGSCCATSGPCGLGEGGCDNDSDCTGDLVCGENNCLAGNLEMDCCKSE